MAVKLAFNELPQFLDGNGVPYAGAQLFTYASGSSTKQTTYQNALGSVQNTNPIVCDANGRVPYPIWLTTGLTYKFVLAPSTDTDPPNSPIWTLDNVTGINDNSSAQDEWAISGLTPTYVSATQFTLAGDQTTAFHVGRRVKGSVTAGTSYGTITASVFGAVTTVTVTTTGSNPLDSGLSAVSYGVMSAVNTSWPQLIVAGNGVSVSWSNGKPTISATIIPKNYAINGSFAVNQDVTPTTTDNTYPFDGWRLLLGAANAATISQDTADVPTGAGFAAKLVVGSGNNNKFGIFCPIENKDMLDLRSGTCSIRVPLKATAALTNIKIAIIQWTGTADSITATPISAWGNAGTNPTLIANWTYANTATTNSVTTSWADYTITGIAISASATNIGIFIWSDDKTNTQTTDIMRVGGYVTLANGSGAPTAIVAPFDEELRKCQRYYNKTFNLATTPAQNIGINTGEFIMAAITASVQTQGTWALPVRMRVAPTVTLYNPAGTNALARNESSNADCTPTAASRIGEQTIGISTTTDGGATNGNLIGIHAIAVARL